MHKADNPSRWYHPWRSPVRVTEDDPADLGTAFGLDLSLSTEPAAAPARRAPPQRSAGWVPRWAMRRKPVL